MFVSIHQFVRRRKYIFLQCWSKLQSVHIKVQFIWGGGGNVWFAIHMYDYSYLIRSSL